MSADQSVQWLDETRLSDLEKSPPRLRLGHEGAPQPNVRVESFEEDDEDEYECWSRFCAKNESEVNILVRAGRDLEGNPDCPPDGEDCICDECARKVMQIIEARERERRR